MRPDTPIVYQGVDSFKGAGSKVLSVPNDTTKAYAEVTANNPDRGAIGVLNENCSHDICKKLKELK